MYYTYNYICIIAYTYVYVHIYIYRERENACIVLTWRAGAAELPFNKGLSVCAYCQCIYIYIYMLCIQYNICTYMCMYVYIYIYIHMYTITYNSVVWLFIVSSLVKCFVFVWRAWPNRIDVHKSREQRAEMATQHIALTLR